MLFDFIKNRFCCFSLISVHLLPTEALGYFSGQLQAHKPVELFAQPSIMSSTVYSF